MPNVHVCLPARKQDYEIKIGAGLLSTLGSEARGCLGPGRRRVAVISNNCVFELFGKQATRSLRKTGLEVTHWLMREGERHKSLSSLGQALAFLTQSEIERSDAVLALGGGVVGDLAGFAAATYLRCIAFIQVPTTVLAQIDASVRV